MNRPALAAGPGAGGHPSRRAARAAADASPLPWNEPLRADDHYGASFDAWNAVVNR